MAYPPREQDSGSRVGVPALSHGMERTRQGESRSDRYFYCASQVWDSRGLKSRLLLFSFHSIHFWEDTLRSIELIFGKIGLDSISYECIERIHILICTIFHDRFKLNPRLR